MTNGYTVRINQSETLNISNRVVEADASLGSITITLPLYVNEGYTLKIIDIAGISATNEIIIQVQGNSLINGGNSISLDSNFSEATISYDTYTTSHLFSAVIHTSGSGGGGTVTTAYNGLSVVGGTDIILGGTLLQPTAVEAEGYNLMFRGVDPFTFRDARVAINAESGAAKMASDSDNIHIGWDAAINKVLIQSGILDNVTITNDGTNNIILDPASLDANHNTLIRLQFNELAAKASTISMDNVESVFNYTNTATGAISQHSLNDSYWTASYQSANLANIQLDDNWVRTVWQNGSTADVSYIIAQNGNVTLENTDGITTSTVRVDAANGISLISQTPLFINIPSTPQPVGSVLTLLDNSNGECEWQQLANPTGDSMLIQASDPEILSLNSPNNLIATIGPSSFDLPDISTLAVGATKSFTCYKSVATGNVALNCTAGATCEGRFGGLFFSGTGGFVLTSQGQTVTLTAIGGSNVWFVSNSNI